MSLCFSFSNTEFWTCVHSVITFFFCFSIQKRPYLVVGGQDGYLYMYNMDPGEGGECTLVKQHRYIQHYLDINEPPEPIRVEKVSVSRYVEPEVEPIMSTMTPEAKALLEKAVQGSSPPNYTPPVVTPPMTFVRTQAGMRPVFEVPAYMAPTPVRMPRVTAAERALISVTSPKLCA